MRHEALVWFFWSPFLALLYKEFKMTAHYSNLINRPDSEAVPIPAESRTTQGQGAYIGFFKRLLDVTLIIIALPIVLPVILILAALAALDGNAPFYTQKRVGLNGRSFTMWKLRTMVPDAEHKLQSYLQTDSDARREWESSQKLKQDPRITVIGKILRKTSLDELPQLWNVLRGDMSLIGPRPMLLEQEALYPGPAYFGMRPGITGNWQISDRNECHFSDRASFDQRYKYSVSFSTDLYILMQTVRVVLRGTGY